MGWDDRPYHRDRSGSYANPLTWLNGSIPLASISGVRIRAHVTLLLLILTTICFGSSKLFSVQERLLAMAILCLVVALHELGRCLTARLTRSVPIDEVVLWPLGGLNAIESTRRRWPALATIASGPLANLAVCGIAAIGVYAFTAPHAAHGTITSGIITSAHRWPSLNPFQPLPPPAIRSWTQPAFYFWWMFAISWIVLLFNLLPIYPLDGGQALHHFLAPAVGHYRALLVSTVTGISGSMFIAVVSLFTQQWGLLVLAIFLFYSSYQRRTALREAGAEDWPDSTDYSPTLFVKEDGRPVKKRRRINGRALHRARKIARQETLARQQIDDLLAKVSANGLASLTWRERRKLRKASARQQRQESELSKFM